MATKFAHAQAIPSNEVRLRIRGLIHLHDDQFAMPDVSAIQIPDLTEFQETLIGSGYERREVADAVAEMIGRLWKRQLANIFAERCSEISSSEF